MTQIYRSFMYFFCLVASHSPKLRKKVIRNLEAYSICILKNNQVYQTCLLKNEKCLL